MSSSQRRKPMSWAEVTAFALLGLAVVLLVRSSRSGGSAGIVPAGTPFPALMAEGWLNVDGPPYDGTLSLKNLKGRVVVVDCWATWCPPCRRAMPELADLYAKYRPMGVEFLGLTSQATGDLPVIEQFIGSVDGFDWPVGYGTMPMQDMLGIRVLPTVVVFGPEGTAVWSSSRLSGIEAALDQQLAKAARE